MLAVVGFFTWVTYPNYDSYYALLWGDELLDGKLPSFEAYRAPTEHPLAVVFGAALSVLGQDADRVMVLFTLFSFVALVAGTYKLGRTAFTPFVGAIAAFLVLTRFDFPSLAVRALPRHPLHGRDRVGGRARGGAAAPRHAGVPAACAARACCGPRPGSCPASTSCG